MARLQFPFDLFLFIRKRKKEEEDTEVVPQTTLPTIANTIKRLDYYPIARCEIIGEPEWLPMLVIHEQKIRPDLTSHKTTTTTTTTQGGLLANAPTIQLKRLTTKTFLLQNKIPPVARSSAQLSFTFQPGKESRKREKNEWRCITTSSHVGRHAKRTRAVHTNNKKMSSDHFRPPSPVDCACQTLVSATNGTFNIKRK